MHMPPALPRHATPTDARTVKSLAELSDVWEFMQMPDATQGAQARNEARELEALWEQARRDVLQEAQQASTQGILSRLRALFA